MSTFISHRSQLAVLVVLVGSTIIACDSTHSVDNAPVVVPDGYTIVADDARAASPDGGPSGDATADDDAGPVVELTPKDHCGNGKVDVGELCDVAIASGEGACPVSCDDGDVSTDDLLMGKGCLAHCGFVAIVDCLDDDGTCPDGCDDSTDNDCAPQCGNGQLDPSEFCDLGIAAGAAGACPASCDDGVACTTDELLGTDCDATCAHTAINFCDAAVSDGCCPAGCDATSDVDCSATCGNGVVESGETCDTTIPQGQPGACPTSCDDGNNCSADVLQGGDCGLSCTHLPITLCALQADGCCPAGCDHTTDGDCQPPTPTCGNGVVDSGESCDIGVPLYTPGACPASCNDGNQCTIDTLIGSLCSQSCSHSSITACNLQSDGCCPAGCDATTDADCSPSCGNGVVESGESCDTAITFPDAGSCPASCDDGVVCTTDSFTGGGCGLTCANAPITTCKSGDGCCPAGCASTNDDDCAPVCGNGVVESGELCDGVNFGGKTCQTEGFDTGSLSCSPTCTQMRTNGCSKCGNGIVETGEACDGTNFGGKTCQTEGYGGGSLSCASDCSAYRSGSCTR